MIDAPENARPAFPIGVIVLAAGGSTRMGEPKQLLRVGGQSLLRRAAETALASQCRPVVIVLGANAEALRGEVASLPARVVVNAGWGEGVGASVRAGVAALLEAEGEREACVITLCDQPLVTAARIDELVETFRAARPDVVAARYAGGAGGVPALFGRALFGELSNLCGDQVARRHRARRATGRDGGRSRSGVRR